jgi:hypothetical protein
MKKSIVEKDPKTQSIIRLFLCLIIGVIIGLVISIGSLAVLQNRVGSISEIRSIWPAFSTNFTIETIIICMNLSLLIGLLAGYRSDFRKTNSPFLLGLILFILVLIIQSFLSLPILNLIISLITIGARQGFFYILLTYKASIFSIIAHFFETVALIILFHLGSE